MKILYLTAGAVAAAVVSASAIVLILGEEGVREDIIRVAFFPNIGHAIPIVGTSEGFAFDSEMVEIRIFDSGPQAIESLFANAIDVAYVGPGPAVSGFLNSESDEIVILAGAASGGSSFVVHPDSGIAAGADLGGKVVAAPQIANTQDVSLRHYIAERGLDTAERGGSVRVLNVANPEIHTLFAKGEIDAAWVPEPWGTILVRDLDGIRLFHEEELWPDGRFASVLLVAKKDFVMDNPELAQWWLSGHNETSRWINENTNATEEIFAEFMLNEMRTRFSSGILEESFTNIEITPDTNRDSIITFAARADSMGYLGREGYELDGIFYDTPGAGR